MGFFIVILSVSFPAVKAYFTLGLIVAWKAMSFEQKEIINTSTSGLLSHCTCFQEVFDLLHLHCTDHVCVFSFHFSPYLGLMKFWERKQ